jgi:hypothetical protein
MPYGPQRKGAVRTAPPIRTRDLSPRFLASLRRLGVDEETLQVLTGKVKRRR